MATEKKSMSLPLKLLIGIVVGIVLGLFLPESVMTIVVTLKYVLNQLIMFCVPLIVIGFIAPSITKMGSNATRMLMVAIVVAYASTVLATLMSMAAGYVLVPFLPIASTMEGLKELPGVAFQLDIPQIMPVMSALVFSVLIGLAAVWTKAKTITVVLQEFQNIVLSVVKKVVIPVLPFFIALTFCGLSYDGTITKQFPAFLLAIAIVMAGHYIWMAILYGFAGAYSGRSAIEVVKHYGPAYLTAVGTMSSAATLAVALDWRILLVLAAMTAANYAIALWAWRFNMRTKGEADKDLRGQNYFFRLSRNPANGKDIRLYRMEQWIMGAVTACVMRRDSWRRRSFGRRALR